MSAHDYPLIALAVAVVTWFLLRPVLAARAVRRRWGRTTAHPIFREAEAAQAFHLALPRPLRFIHRALHRRRRARRE